MHSLILLISILFFVTPATYGQTTTYATFSSGSLTNDRFTQWLNLLTTIDSNGVRVVHSSGGAAGGIVSEGQGYGVFLSAATAIALGSSDSRYSSTVDIAYSLFLGWKAMCKGSTVGNNCQGPSSPAYYCSDSAGSYPCLPHWKFNDQLGNWEYGSATDGDIDAIAGMALLVAATANNKKTWWTDVAQWTYASAKQFYDHGVQEVTVGGVTESIVKLGSCWGGLSCTNPSYHAPGHYRLISNWLNTYGAALGKPSTEISSYVAKYQQLIKSTYKILSSNQNDYGLITNWYIPNQSDLSKAGSENSGACGGSGTAVDQYGSEAARGTWRVSVDYIWYKSTESKTYLDKIAKQLTSTFTGSSFTLTTGGFVNSVFGDWQNNAFIYGPTYCALVDKISTATNQDAAIAKARDIIQGASITDYYAGSWIAISTLTLSGDLAKAASLAGGSPPAPVAPVAPVTPVKPPVAPVAPVAPVTPVKPPVAPVAPVAPVKPPVTPPPVPTAPTSTKTCTLKGCSINLYYIEFATSTTGVTNANVLCSDGRTVACTVVTSGTNGKYKCSVTDSKSCLSPTPQLDGVKCPLSIPNSGKTCTSGSTNSWWVEFFPPVNPGYNVALGSVRCEDGSYQACVDGGGNPGKLNCQISGNACTKPTPIYDGSYCLFPGTTIPASSIISDSDTLTSNSFPAWAVATIIVGVALVIIALVITVVVIRKRRQTQEIV